MTLQEFTASLRGELESVIRDTAADLRTVENPVTREMLIEVLAGLGGMRAELAEPAIASPTVGNAPGV